MLTPLVLLLLLPQTYIPPTPSRQAPEITKATPREGTEGSSRLVIFDVADLIAAQDFTLNPGEETRRKSALDQLIAVIMDKLPPAAREDLVRLSGRPSGTLFAEGGPKSLEFIETFLDTQRRERAPLSVSMRLIEAPRSLLQGLGVEGSSKVFEDPKELDELLAKLVEAPGVDVIQAPRVAFKPLTSASISALNQVAYVSNYELQIVEPGHAAILDPVIDVVQEGVSVELQGVPMPGGVVEFKIDVESTELERPIPTRRVRIGAYDHEVEISEPELAEVTIHAQLSLFPGSAALIASAAPDEERDFIVLVHFERLQFEPSPRVDALFQSMREGRYGHRWFPPLEWEDIPALLARSTDSETYSSYPKSPLGDVRPPVVVGGACALWFIEGLREEGHCPSFVPLLVEGDQPLDASPAHQNNLLKRAREAYRAWYAAFDAGEVDPGAPCPLEAVGLAWL